MKRNFVTVLKLGLFLTLSTCLILGCKKSNKTVHHYQVPKQASASTQAAPPPVSTTTPEFTWIVPDNWQETDSSSSMRLATFIQETEHGNAECSVFELIGQAGGLVDNVNRWRQQLGLDKESPEEITQSAQTLNGPLGTIHVFELLNQATPDRAFLAAIITLPDSTFFVKVACSQAAIPLVKPSFNSFCKSINKS